MNAKSSMYMLATMAISFLVSVGAVAHPDHDADEGHAESPVIHLAQESEPSAANDSEGKVSGQGEYIFRVLYDSSHLPPEAQPGVVPAHGGFGVDRRPGQGEIYFALPRVGILRISSDLSKVDLIQTDLPVKNNVMHNALVWTNAQGTPFLTFPGPTAQKVYTTDLDGRLLNTLPKPSSDMTFEAEGINRYFDDPKMPFTPTDVEFANNRFYITTGYSMLDFVLTANVKAKRRVSAEWTPKAFGGKGTKPGMFGTGHGITLMPDGKTLAVADRPNSEVEHFDLKGNYLDKLTLPAGSFPCDIDYEDDLAVVGCLHGPDRDKGAPIYIVKDGEVVSTIMPKEELGLKWFQHIHNSVIVKRNDKLYVIALAWNPGDFAILEQVK